MPATWKEHGSRMGKRFRRREVSTATYANSSLTNFSFLHSLFIGIDANFRLKRKKASNDTNDPGLGHGIAYIVEEKAYKAHIANYTQEKEPVSQEQFSELTPY